MSWGYKGGIKLPGYDPLQVANAPTIGTATAGNSLCASVSFTAPSCTGGSVITTYTVFANCGALTATGAASPITVTGLTNAASYTFRVIATNIYGPSYPSSASNSITASNAGSQSYTTAGTYSWVAPAGVTSVSVVVVGGGGGGANYGGSGGGLAYKNNVSVTPGSSYNVVVGVGGTQAFSTPSSTIGGNSSFTAGFGTVTATGGRSSGASSPAVGAPSGTYDGGGSGGTTTSGAGGGAAGYSGNGGNSGSGGAGGGGGGGKAGGGGGGVGILGQGSNGTSICYRGTGGSGGGSGECYQLVGNVNGGAYGGGAGGPCVQQGQVTGGSGAVRIMWPGNTRSFPSTNAGNP